jgi:glycosyltransferase XagB
VNAPADAPRVGDLLVAEGWIDERQRAWALDVQHRTGSRLGSILVAAGLVRRADLYRLLARTWDADFVDLTETTPDPQLLAGLDPEHLAARGWLPVREQDGGVVVAVAERPDPALRAEIAEALGRRIVLRVTTDWDLVAALHRGFREVVADRATLGLWSRSRRQSARQVLTRGQQVLGVLLLTALVAGLVLAPRGTLVVLSGVVGLGFLAAVLFKFVVCMVGVHREAQETVTEQDLAALDDRDLPMYTVLVPVFREANVVADLIANLGALDYPREKLEILLLLEENDTETIEAARAADPPETISFLVIPPGAPQTKPKACNVGLFFARGEHLVIYDAEDKPDPDQLRKAVVAFRRGGDDLVCVQAALNYWNAADNWLTRMFTTEYSFWFDYMLPGLERLGLPIPLGGTSNHFRTSALRTLGGWDPFNVTEDADLGIRAAAMGWRVGVVNSTTYEEANRAPGNWIRQRSRWIKGYLQTLLVHLRSPRSLVRTAGLRQSVAFALLIGGTPAAFLFTPPLYALFVLSLLVPPDVLSPYFPGWVLWVSLFNLIIGNGLMIYISMMGAFKRRRYALVMWALLNPAYWLLHAAASYKAVWQLVTRPHYWEKTVHGLSSTDGHAADQRPGSGALPVAG